MTHRNVAWIAVCTLVLMSCSSARHVQEPQPGPARQMTKADSLLQAKKHLAFGVRYLKNEQFGDAETQLTHAWNYDPSNALTAYHRGKLFYDQEIHQEAFGWFRRSIELAPKRKSTTDAILEMALATPDTSTIRALLEAGSVEPSKLTTAALRGDM